MIEWILGHLGVVIFLVIFLSQIARAVLRSRKAAAQHEAQRDDSAEARRVREIQEQIRRQIAARRAGHSPDAPPPPLVSETRERPIARPETTQMPEPFGGPLGRMLEELQKRTQPPPPVVTPPQRHVEARNVAEIERQQQLAEKLKALEDARAMASRRAAHVAADKNEEAHSERGLRTAARDQLLRDLSDARSLRRAFVLREVLGTPVGMR